MRCAVVLKIRPFERIQENGLKRQESFRRLRERSIVDLQSFGHADNSRDVLGPGSVSLLLRPAVLKRIKGCRALPIKEADPFGPVELVG